MEYNIEGGFGEDYAFGVADTLLAEADAVGRERDMGVFGDVFRIYYHATVLFAAEVEDLGVMNIECPELGDNAVEVDAPYDFPVIGAD